MFGSGFFLLAPTGSGKSWACGNDPFFVDFAIDGDSLIDWSKTNANTDWNIKDRENLDIVLSRMRRASKCICWFVGTTAIKDAINEGRISRNNIAVVLPSSNLHYGFVQSRTKIDHGWTKALDHRKLCEGLIQDFNLRSFVSFADAAEHIRKAMNAIRLVAIGHMGRFDVYANVTVDEAIARHDRENPENTVADNNYTVREINVPNGHFEVYDIWGEE